MAATLKCNKISPNTIYNNLTHVVPAQVSHGQCYHIESEKKNICKKRSPLSYISSQVSYHSGYILENSMIIYILPFELFIWPGLT